MDSDNNMEREAADVALSETEARLRALYDALPQLLWIVRACDGMLIYANQHFHAYFGDIGPTRQARIDAAHPDDSERVNRAWAMSMATGVVYDLDARWRRRDGIYRWHKFFLAPIRSHGRIVEWIGTALDIDEIVTAHEALREKSDLLRLAQEAAGAGLFDWDLVGNNGCLSPESLRLFGLQGESPTAIDARLWASIVHPDDLPSLAVAADHAVATGSAYRAEFRVRRPGEPDGWILGVGRVVTDAAGHPERIVGLNIDVTERKRTEEISRLNEERLALALDSGSDGLWDWTVTTGEVWYSDRWSTMLGYEPGELPGHASTWERLIHPDDRDRAVALTTAHFESQSDAYECEHRLRRKDGEWAWVLSRGKVVGRDPEGRPIRIVGTHVDISARKAAESQIAHMARHDALTDLPNRTLFRAYLDQRLADIARHGGSCAVLCLDLDRFKTVNDTLGHLAGDALLREIAHRFRTTLRADEIVARLGGDEFAILLSSAGQLTSIMTLAERLIAIVGAPVAFGEHQVEVGLSIGIALAPEHGCDGEDVFKHADLALYRAKAAGRNTARCYEPFMDQEAAERRQMERDLRGALALQQFVLHYQPQVNGATGLCVGFEALVRWHHPVHGLVPPARFIPLAEETGLIVGLGEWVLRTACREAARWANPLKIAVNVSPRQFQQADLPDMILAILAETGLSPGRLELEITESVIINDMTRALNILRRLKNLGVGIAMDDFGTGYSSLSTLKAFPFDKIKIDRSFVGHVESSPQAAAIVRAVLALGRSLGMGVVAEGVETANQSRFLAEEACEELQGYYFGKPAPIDHFAGTVHQGGDLPPAPTITPEAARKAAVPRPRKRIGATEA